MSDSKREFKHFGNNRYLCSVLDDMRKCVETLNFAPIKGLIEEAQILGNRMESGLADKKDLIRLNEDMASARRDYKALRKEYRKLESQVNAAKKV